MMKLFLVFTLLSVAVTISAQTTTKTKPVAKTSTAKPAVKQPALKNLSDSASYALGVGIANFYEQQVSYFKQQGITNLNTSLTLKAVNDVLTGKPALLNDDMANAVLNKLIIQVQEEKCKPNIDAGAAFLAKNKTKAGVKTTASGLQYEVITEGTGIKPTSVDTFVCHYRGTLLNGTEFDASYNRGQPLVYPVKDVIRGWTEGLQLMAVGSKYKFYIPHTLGYGTADNQSIPGGSTLIFEVELLDVKKAN
ncbi:MAG TPA: FKBP-type peptidyl-prolyl cis-trans isomerase [Chitinophagaceae bacterium]|nr:FKBP-type peptidyl-prolyl cis-trans isomerase [Chitinophagaceae bacterium]